MSGVWWIGGAALGAVWGAVWWWRDHRRDLAYRALEARSGLVEAASQRDLDVFKARLAEAMAAQEAEEVEAAVVEEAERVLDEAWVRFGPAGDRRDESGGER